MTAAELSGLETHVGEWTTDDLDKLPESTRHHELIDGVLIVPPAPTNVHQTIAGLLMATLHAGCPAGYYVTQGVEVRISKVRSLIPDVLVLTADAAERRTYKFAPNEVMLAVEVVSACSVTMDRVTKPALYAQAGIPFYWIVETDPELVIRTFRLNPAAEVYEPTGEFSETLSVAEPWSIEISLSRLGPRR